MNSILSYFFVCLYSVRIPTHKSEKQKEQQKRETERTTAKDLAACSEPALKIIIIQHTASPNNHESSSPLLHHQCSLYHCSYRFGS